MLDAQSIGVWSADKAGAGPRDPPWSAEAQRLRTPAARCLGSSTPFDPNEQAATGADTAARCEKCRVVRRR
jgi:hypothetical protein